MIRLDRALGLNYRLLLVVELLFGDGVSGIGCLVPLQIDPRLRQHSLIAFQSSFRLRQQRLIGARIDVDQRVALAHHLAFAVMDRHDPACNLAVDRDCVGRRHCAQGGYINIAVAGD